MSARSHFAAAYYRMSTDRQEDSIDRQRSQVEAYAARQGYAIVRDYLDEGIAGDEERKRKGFLQMLQDAARGDFAVILCDDKDRFGRFDSITSGYYIKPLRDAGVRLETVAQGRADWTSFAGRVTDAVLQEAKKIESQATSRRVLTQMVQMARKGLWLGGPPPYGYVLVDDELYGKRLVPGDPIHVKAVQLIFRRFADQGASLQDIGKALYDRGVPSPSGRPFWCVATIRAVLKNRKYVGDFTWNRGSEGKYSRLGGGLVNASDAQTTVRTWNATDDWIVIPDVHEALVSREQYERAQARLAENSKKAGPHGGRRPAGRTFLLTGLLVCGDCGGHMIGTTWAGGVRTYKCGRYHQEGSRSCYSNGIRERGLLKCIANKLIAVLLDPANLEKLRSEIRRQATADADELPGKLAELERRAADLDRKIEGGLERIMLVSRELVPEMDAMIRRFRAERADVTRQVLDLKGPQPSREKELDATVRAAESYLFQLRDVLEEADYATARTLLAQMVSRIELQFDHRKVGHVNRSTLRRGIIYVRPQPGLDLTCLAEGAVRRTARRATREQQDIRPAPGSQPDSGRPSE
jgi:DNA invertase Pin-like site-specific DNA recombinase